MYIMETHFFLLLQASAPVLQIFSRKVKRKLIFCNYLPKYHVIKVWYFHKNGPFVSHVADKFCLFCDTLKRKCEQPLKFSRKFATFREVLREISRYFSKFSQAVFTKM
jgi:hypothetical protein